MRSGGKRVRRGVEGGADGRKRLLSMSHVSRQTTDFVAFKIGRMGGVQMYRLFVCLFVATPQ
jgi:hypothetical protein